MLISTWLRSFRNRLQGQPRRPNRRSPEQASRTLEHLEARHLLAAPQLINVQDEGSRVITSGQEIQNSPSALVLDFSSTPDLDATTITTITLERAGQDGAFDGTDVLIPVTVSIVGAAPNEVVLQLGQTLPSDLYRINLPGTLANTLGEMLNGGVDSAFNFSIQLPPRAVQSVLPAHPQTSDATPTIQWVPVAGSPPGSNATYNVELQNAANQVVGFQEGHVGESITISDPLPPGVYTAFITSINRAGVALLPPSQLRSFEVVAISVTSPAGVIQDNTPTITWTPVDRTDHYELQIRSGLTGASVLEELNLTDTSFTVDPALDLGSYQVRVRAIEDTTDQIGDWSVFQNFQIGTSPAITSPVPLAGQTAAVVTVGTPTITWDAVQGAATYDVVIIDVTDNINPLQTLTGLTTTSITLTQPLELGEYTIQVRGVTVDSLAGEYSAPATLLVRLPTTVSLPTGRLEDSTPTISWTAVSGAERYDLEIIRTVNSIEVVVYNAPGITGTTHTVPTANALPIGQYQIRVIAQNLAAPASSGQTVTSLNIPAAFIVATPPQVLLPNSGIYDTTPEITWILPAGADVSRVTITNALTNAVVIDLPGIVGNSTVLTNPLAPGEYQVVVESSTTTGPAVTSNPSTAHVFRVGSAPVPLGPSQGLGNAPFFEVVDKRPTLTWQQSIAGEEFSVWVTDVTNQEVITITHGLQEASYTLQQDLPVGRYRYWARADNGLGDQSAWSAPHVFDVKTRPVLQPVQPTFNPRPTFTWNTAATGNLQPEIDQYRVFIRRVDVTPVVDIDTGFTVAGNQYTPTEDLPNGRYRIWVKGVNETSVSKGTVEIIWSVGQDFEISGRPIVTNPGNTDDSTPLIIWSPVGQASSYQLYIAPANAAGSPVVNISGLTATSFQVSDPLANGNYVAWVRTTSITGQISPWSLTPQGQFTISGSDAGGIDKVVVSAIPPGTDRTPTFTWTPDAAADHYDIFVASRSATNVALIRDTNVPGTTYTSTRQLAPGEYRVWVRAIAVDGIIGPWSTPVDFTVLAANNGTTTGVTDIVMLASIDAASAALQFDQVSVGLMQRVVMNERVQATAEADASEQSTPQQPAAISSDAGTAEASLQSDDVMAEWDKAIWAEESGGVLSVASAGSVSVEATRPKGWLAGMAMVSTSLFRRQKKNDE
jgi:hypothetical protein